MRVFITGGTGFAGSHLVDYIAEHHPTYTIQVLKRWRSNSENLAHFPEGRIKFYEGDLTDPHGLRTILERAQPDRIFHVAAQTFVPYSYVNPIATLDTNCQGTIHLLEAYRAVCPKAKFLLVSSGEVYGSHEEPITELSQLNVRSPYGLGKLAQDRACYMYQQAYGLPILIARSFSQVGPRKWEGLVDSSWCKQVARMEKHMQKPVLSVGRLDSIRTFCDVREMVQAYWMFMDQGTPGELYNICGDEVLSMQKILDLLRSLTTVSFDVVEDPFLLRPTDVARLEPQSTSFRTRFAWQPKIPYRDSLTQLLEYWRARI